MSQIEPDNGGGAGAGAGAGAKSEATQKARVVALARKRLLLKRLAYCFDPENDRCLTSVCTEDGKLKVSVE